MIPSQYNGILITGGCGMVGSHLIDFYHQKGETCVATFFRPTILFSEMMGKAQLEPCDVRSAEAVFTLIDRYRPHTIFHLAAQSYPTVSWEKPAETMDINANGTVNVFEAVKRVRKSEPSYDPMVVVACSSAEYGASLHPDKVPIREDEILQPLHPYGVSKVAQDLLSYQYWISDSIRCVRARIFNTTGPRKQNDVAGDFTQRAILIEKGKESRLRVGNVTASRAITDVRDLTLALRLLAEKGEPGEVYNICGEHSYLVSDVLRIVTEYAQCPITVWEDPSLFRPTDEPIIWGDASRLKAQTGWKQTYTLEQTLHDMMDYWRAVL